jgi:hypothetical protein
MRPLFLAISLLSINSVVSAAPCSQTPSGPCTPDDGDATNDAVSDIVNYISDAQKAEPIVKKALADYLAIRRNGNATAADKMAVFNEYVGVKTDQDELYAEAINKTAALYHVRPQHTGQIAIGAPAEADLQYVTGLSATWKPQATDSGPGVNLAIRIEGTDGPRSGLRLLDQKAMIARGPMVPVLPGSSTVENAGPPDLKPGTMLIKINDHDQQNIRRRVVRVAVGSRSRRRPGFEARCGRARACPGRAARAARPRVVLVRGG